MPSREKLKTSKGKAIRSPQSKRRNVGRAMSEMIFENVESLDNQNDKNCHPISIIKRDYWTAEL
jgi:hypothetical protein